MTRNDWRSGTIDDCTLRPIRRFGDDRGWLAEIFRTDELETRNRPEMAYISLTHDGVSRGPHAHRDQADLFVFFDGRFTVWLWDDRPDSPSYGIRSVISAGGDAPCTLIVPPGVVHAYRNDSGRDALIVNCPNRLFAGHGKAEPVDEVRYEDDPDSPFRLDD